MRELFSTPRASEFFDKRALQAQTGQRACQFGVVVLKELMDNALDAAESSGARPDISLDVTWEDATGLAVTVADNGPGMTPALIDQILDFDVLVSDKSHYRAPTRGLQGNAWKTLLGIPSALGGHEPVVIESCGCRHEIQAGIDHAGEVRVDRRTEPSSIQSGSTVTVTLPCDDLVVDRYADFWDAPGVQVIDGYRWAAGYALVNPHAAITYQGKSADPEEAVSYKPTIRDGWRKPLPTDPTSAHHYDQAGLRRLVVAHINKTRRGGRDVPLGEFVRSFAGLAGTAKAKTVCAALPGISRLSDLDGNIELVDHLLAAMRAASRPPNASTLGRVGEAHYKASFAESYGIERFWFKRTATADAGGVPWIIEIAVAETTEPGDLFYAVNYSPTFDDPLTRLPLSAGEIRTAGIASFLKAMDAWPDGQSCRAAAIHLITPAAAFLDKGKSTLAVAG